MSKIPETLRYSETHEWVEDLGDGRCRVGITDHAQELLGDLVYVEAPAAGKAIRGGEACGVLESVKAAADFYAPVDGTVTAHNEALGDHPQWINEDPYGRGWIMELETHADACSGLMDAAAYGKLTES